MAQKVLPTLGLLLLLVSNLVVCTVSVRLQKGDSGDGDHDHHDEDAGSAEEQGGNDHGGHHEDGHDDSHHGDEQGENDHGGHHEDGHDDSHHGEAHGDEDDDENHGHAKKKKVPLSSKKDWNDILQREGVRASDTVSVPKIVGAIKKADGCPALKPGDSPEVQSHKAEARDVLIANIPDIDIETLCTAMAEKDMESRRKMAASACIPKKFSMKELETILGRSIVDKLRESGVLEGFLKALTVPRDEVDQEDIEKSLEKVNTPKVVETENIVAAIQDGLRTPAGKSALKSAFENLVPKVAYSPDEIASVLSSCKVHFNLDCMTQALKDGIMGADAQAVKGCINDLHTRRNLDMSKFRASFDAHVSRSAGSAREDTANQAEGGPSPCLFVTSAAESLGLPRQEATGPATLTGIQPGTEDDWSVEKERAFNTRTVLESDGVVNAPGDPAAIMAQTTQEDAEHAFADISKLSPLCSKFRMVGSGIRMVDQETRDEDEQVKAVTSPSQALELKRKAQHYEEVLDLVGSMLARALETQGKTVPANLGDVVKVAMDVDRLDNLEGKFGDAEAVPPLARVLQATRIWCLDHNVDSELKAAQTMIVGERSVKSDNAEEKEASHVVTADSPEKTDDASKKQDKKDAVVDANNEQVHEMRKASMTNRDGIAAIAYGEKPADLIAEGLGKAGKDGTVNMDKLMDTTVGSSDIGKFHDAIANVLKDIPGIKNAVLRHAISSDGKVDKEALRNAFAAVPADVGIAFDKVARGVSILSDAVAILNLHEALSGSGVREGILINGLRSRKASKLAEAMNFEVEPQRQVDGDALLKLLQLPEISPPKANAVLGKRLEMLGADSPFLVAKLMKRLLSGVGGPTDDLGSQIESRTVPDIVRSATRPPSTPDDRAHVDEEERTSEKSAEFAKVADALGSLSGDLDLPRFLVAVHAGDEDKVVNSFDEEVRAHLKPGMIVQGFKSSSLEKAQEGMAPFFEALQADRFKLLFDAIKLCLARPDLTGHEANDSDVSAWKSLQEVSSDDGDAGIKKNTAAVEDIKPVDMTERSSGISGRPSLRKRFK